MGEWKKIARGRRFRECAVGCKTNSHGRKETWRDCQLHLHVADGQIPIRGVLTSANLHDSPVAVALATMTAARVTCVVHLNRPGVFYLLPS